MAKVTQGRKISRISVKNKKESFYKFIKVDRMNSKNVDIFHWSDFLKSWCPIAGIDVQCTL
jgi:hypothetical protein